MTRPAKVGDLAIVQIKPPAPDPLVWRWCLAVVVDLDEAGEPIVERPPGAKSLGWPMPKPVVGGFVVYPEQFGRRAGEIVRTLSGLWDSAEAAKAAIAGAFLPPDAP
jgi:hypothetical protein